MRLFSVTHVSLSKKNCEIMEYNDIYRIATLIVKSIKRIFLKRNTGNWIIGVMVRKGIVNCIKNISMQSF